MDLSHFNISPDRGFLPQPDPLTHLTQVESGLAPDAVDTLEEMAVAAPGLLVSGEVRARLDDLPVFDLSAAQDTAVIERLFSMFAYFANSYIFATPDDPAGHLPPGVAVPFHQLAEKVERPPILSYPAMVLNNWRRLEADGPLELENLAAQRQFATTPDERWFGLVHVAIEAQAGPALQGISDALAAVAAGDLPRLTAALQAIASGIAAMIKTFHRIKEGCDPDVYHSQVRPYMFGFDGIIFEGVEAYGGAPQKLTGGSGAQSSVIPALVGALGIEHEKTGLMKHLDGMQRHMPKEHQAFIRAVTTSAVRDYVLQHADNVALKDAYNHCLREMITFRRAHFYYAKVYIFDKTENPVGTGGTPFMDWLTKLIAETEAQMI